MQPYREIERRIQDAVLARFQFTIGSEGQAAIKQADNVVLKAEARMLMKTGGTQWAWSDTPDAVVQVVGLSPRKAKSLFLDLFVDLYRQ
jgi:hypothetical protein